MDVIAINKAILGKESLTEEQILFADIDGDGQVTPTDSLMIMKFIVGLIDSLD